MFLDPGEVQCLLLDLASVVECVDNRTEIRMLHASFSDFLFDRSRSETYYIDSSVMHAEIAQLCFSHIRVHDLGQCKTCTFLAPSHYLSFPIVHWLVRFTEYAYDDIITHLSKAELSADLREALLNTTYITSLIKLEHWPISHLLVKFLSFLKSSVGYELPDADAVAWFAIASNS